jgi:drug/metabolite transporter (DMT)-like permease
MRISGSATASGTVELSAAMVISGSIGLFVTESGQSPYNVVLVRCALGAALLWIYCGARGYVRRVYFEPRTLLPLLASGSCIIFNWVLFFKSFAFTSIGLSTLVYHVNPFVILGFGALFFGDRITAHQIIWTALAFLGLVLIIDIDVSVDTAMATGFGERLIGVALALVATTFYSVTVVITKRYGTVPPQVILLVQLTLGTFLMLPFATPGDLVHAGAGEWSCLAALGVVHTFLLYSMIYSAYHKLSMATIAILTFIYPVTTVVIDYFYYSRALAPVQWMGIVLIALGTVAVKLNWQIPRLLWPGRVGSS